MFPVAALRKNIEKDLRNDLKGDLEKFIIALLQGVREQGLDKEAAEKDAEDLFNAGEKWDPRENNFIPPTCLFISDVIHEILTFDPMS